METVFEVCTAEASGNALLKCGAFDFALEANMVVVEEFDRPMPTKVMFTLLDYASLQSTQNLSGVCVVYWHWHPTLITSREEV